MISLTNDQMVEISGGLNPDVLQQEVCFKCYRAYEEHGRALAEGATFTLIGAIVAAMVESPEVAFHCIPCITALIGE